MEERNERRIHQLTLSGRENRKEIVLDTEGGVLFIKGEELHMQHLNLEQGKLTLTGRIDSLSYSDESLEQESGSFLKKIFK